MRLATQASKGIYFLEGGLSLSFNAGSMSRTVRERCRVKYISTYIELWKASTPNRFGNKQNAVIPSLPAAGRLGMTR